MLFNVLSSFTIQKAEYEEEEGLFKIVLEYGKASALRSKYKKNYLDLPK